MKSYSIAVMAFVLALIFMACGVNCASFEVLETASSDATSSSERDRIFFSGTADRSSELFSILDDGTELISHGVVDTRNDTDILPRFHKQSNMLVYSTYLSPRSRIFIHPLDAPMLDDAKPVLDFGSVIPFFSPDGRQIVFNRIQENEDDCKFCISVSSIDGKRIEHFPLEDDTKHEGCPQFSHDGRYIVYVRSDFKNSRSKTEIFRMSIDKPNTRELICELSGSVSGFILVSPQADQIFIIQKEFVTIRLESGHEHLIWRSKFVLIDFKNMKDFKFTIIPYSEVIKHDEFAPVSWSSNGKFVYLLREMRDDSGKLTFFLVKLDVESGELTTICEIPA